MERSDTIDPGTIEAVANARIALRGSQTRLTRLLADNEARNVEIVAAREDVANAQARLDEAIRARDFEAHPRTAQPAGSAT